MHHRGLNTRLGRLTLFHETAEIMGGLTQCLPVLFRVYCGFPTSGYPDV